MSFRQGKLVTLDANFYRVADNVVLSYRKNDFVSRTPVLGEFRIEADMGGALSQYEPLLPLFAGGERIEGFLAEQLATEQLFILLEKIDKIGLVECRRPVQFIKSNNDGRWSPSLVGIAVGGCQQCQTQVGIEIEHATDAAF